MLLSPSDELKNGLADVKLAAQRFNSRVAVIATKECRAQTQRQQKVVEKLSELEKQVDKANHQLAEMDRFARIHLLENLMPFIDTIQDASMYSYICQHV